ncbi:MAG: hypothetical protein AAGH79_11995 [Bacteroidota bacterium]
MKMKAPFFTSASLLVVCLLATFGHSQAQNPGAIYKEVTKYCNTRYGFCLEYPTNIFTQKDISINNDGVVLRSTGNDLRLKVFGSFNVLANTAADEYADLMGALRSENPEAITEISKEVADNHLTAFLQAGRKIFYVETLTVGDNVIGLSLEVNRRRAMDQKQAEIEMETLYKSIRFTVDGLE